MHGPYGGSVNTANRSEGFANRAGSGNISGQTREFNGGFGGSGRGGSREGSFNTAAGGSGQGRAGIDTYTGPHGTTYIGGGHAGSYTGPGGRTVGGAGATGVVIGPNGNVHAGHTDVHGISGPSGSAITGSHTGVNAGAGGGASVTHSQGGIAQGAGGATIAGGSRAGAAVGPDGRAVAGGSRGGAVVGPDGRAVAGGSRAGIATGPGGTIAGGSRGAVAVGPNGAVAAGGRAVAGSGRYGAGYYGTRYVAGTNLAGTGYAVRNNFGYYNAFRPGWYGRYPGAWYAAGWIGGSAWAYGNWGAYSSLIGYPATQTAYVYNYGDNLVYSDDGNVYDGGEVLATQEDYAGQAMQFADAGRDAMVAAEEQWQPLGVFAMVQGDETSSDNIFQLALNSAGVVRGNYYNGLTDATTPLYGTLDKKSQRVAWSVGEKKEVVYEAGLYNLTQEQTTMLVHFGKDRTEQYSLVRIEQPKDDAATTPPPAGK